MPFVSPTSPSAVFLGQTVVHQGNDFWTPWTPLLSPLGDIGVVTSGPAYPNQAFSVVTNGLIPLNVTNLGNGLATNVILGATPLRQIGNTGTVIGTCDQFGAVTLSVNAVAAVNSLGGIPVASSPNGLNGQALVVINGVYSPAGVATVLNVKSYGAVGDGIADDTAAIQTAINVLNGTSNTQSGEIFFPSGTYKITSTLTFTGNQGASVRFAGQATGATAGTQIIWNGATGATMWHFYGLNQAEFDNLIINGNHLASTGLWFHYDATNAVGSGQVFFRKCFLYYCVAAGASSGNGSSMVKLGDAASSFEVAGYVFEKCTFYGGTFESGGTQACVMALQSGPGNTEQFCFRDCNFGYAYYGFEFDNANNELPFENCQFAAVYAAVHAAGPCHVVMYQCATELVNGGSFVKQGYFLHGGSQSAKATLDSCEIVIDTTGNAQNAIVSWNGGNLEIVNCYVDGTGGGHTPATVASISVASLGLANSCTVTVRKCVWVNVGVGNSTPQIPVYVGGTNKTDYAAGDAQINRAAVDLHQNIGAPSGGSSTNLPEFQGWPPSLWTVGPWSNIAFGATGLSEVYRAESRQVTTCYEVDYTALTATSTQQQVTLGTVRTKQAVVRVVMEVVTPFKGGVISAMLTEAGYIAGSNAEWIINKDTWTAATAYGLVSGDLGTSLSGAVQGADFGAWTTAKSFGLYFTATGGNLSTLTQGKLKLYVTTEFVDFL